MPVTVIVRSGAQSKEGAQTKPSPSITLDAPLIVVGRGEGCDVRLPDPSVSHRHATIRQRGNEYILVDERSTNGTFMGGVKLGAQAPRLLKHGDLARLGRVWLEVRFDRPSGVASTALATRELALQLVARALDAQGESGGARLTVREGPDAGQSLAIEEPGRAYVIGRGQDVDLPLSDVDASRRHLQVVLRGEQLVLRDLGSKNGAEIGDERVPTDRDGSWRPGQTVRIGKTVLVYEHPAVQALAELEGAGDEVIRPDETLAPPDADTISTDRAAGPLRAMASDAPGRRTLASLEPPSSDYRAAPIARIPERDQRTPPPEAPSGWTSADIVVVLLSVGVLAVSILGLLWLFKG